MKKTLIALSIIIGLAMLYWTFQFFPLQEFLELLKQLPLHLLAAYIGVSTAIYFTLVLRWKIICKQHDVQVPFMSLFWYRYAGFSISFITPGPRVGGEPVRAGMMTKHGIKFPQAMSTVVADKTNELVSFGTMFIIALGAAVLIAPLPPSTRWALGSIAAIMFALVSFGMYNIIRGNDPILAIYKGLRLHKIKWLKKYENEITEFEDNIQGFYGNEPKYFWGAFAVSCIGWSMSLLEFYIILTMIGVNPTVFGIFLVYSVVGAVYLLPIPFALGSLEASQAALFAALGYPVAGGAVLAMITRGRDFLFTFIGLSVIGIHALNRRK